MVDATGNALEKADKDPFVGTLQYGTLEAFRDALGIIRQEELK
jgi:hypothetical protein